MNKRQLEAIELVNRIHEAARQREEAIKLEAMARNQPLDWKQGSPRNLIRELNKIGQTPAIDGLAQLQLMRYSRQLQPDTDHRFAQVVGKTEVRHGGKDDPTHAPWSGQREWESSYSAPKFEDQDSWERSGPERRRGTSGIPVRDEVDESRGAIAMPAPSTPEGHIRDGGGSVTSVKALENEAFAQLKSILAGRQRQSRGLSTF